MTLTSATAEKIFKTARRSIASTSSVRTKAKNIADTGKKTLSYTGPDGHGSCTYNYSENKSVTQLTEMFLRRLPYTMDEGRKLEFLHRYDRLGLDAEMITLDQEREGEACTGTGEHRADADVDRRRRWRLMQRVRDEGGEAAGAGVRRKIASVRLSSICDALRALDRARPSASRSSDSARACAGIVGGHAARACSAEYPAARRLFSQRLALLREALAQEGVEAGGVDTELCEARVRSQAAARWSRPRVAARRRMVAG